MSRIVIVTARRSVAPIWLPWLLALAGFVFDVAAYWPGQMSFDSAYAWWQARGGATSDIVPPVFVLVWRVCDVLLDGPGLLFALHLVLFWSGLALLVRALSFNRVGVLITMLIVAFAPVSLLLRGQVWTDVGLFCALTFTAAALAMAHLRRKRRFLLLALPALFYAATLRHNALPAIVPFAVWFARLLLLDARYGNVRAWLRTGLLSVALLAGVLAVDHVLDASVQRRVPVWPSLAQFDLAAISIATGQMLLPDFMIGAGLGVDELAAAFRVWSNIPMLQNTQHGMRDPFAQDFTAQESSVLKRAWLNAIVDHPRAWLTHRWHLTRALFGVHAADWPRELIYVDAEVSYRDNPPIAANRSDLHVALMRAAAAMSATALLAAWPYLLIGVFAAPYAWQRRHAVAGAVALVLLASAWLYALPLTLLAPSAELRYLGWPCVASLLAFASVVFAPRTEAR